MRSAFLAGTPLTLGSQPDRVGKYRVGDCGESSGRWPRPTKLAIVAPRGGVRSREDEDEEKDELPECASEGQSQLAVLTGTPLVTGKCGGSLGVWRACPPTHGNPFIPSWGLPMLFVFRAWAWRETGAGNEVGKTEKRVSRAAVISDRRD